MRAALSILAMATAMMAAVTGCNNSPGSCSTTTPSGTTCRDYGGGYTATQAQIACQTGSTFSASACPSMNRVGRCTITTTSTSATLVSTVSNYAPFNTAGAMAACTALAGTAAGVTTTTSFQGN